MRGIYAAGEAASGPHGANRMAGHMLTASQVFGKIAGRHAAAAVRSQTIPPPSDQTIRRSLDEIRKLRGMKKGEKPSKITRDLQRLAWENMLVRIHEGLLTDVLQRIEDFRQKRFPHMEVQTPADLIQALELNNLILVAEMLARSTQMRKESRGDLYREDYPERDDRNWNRIILIRQKGDKMNLRTEVIDPDWPASEREEDMSGLRWG